MSVLVRRLWSPNILDVAGAHVGYQIYKVILVDKTVKRYIIALA